MKNLEQIEFGQSQEFQGIDIWAKSGVSGHEIFGQSQGFQGIDIEQLQSKIQLNGHEKLWAKSGFSGH